MAANFGVEILNWTSSFQDGLALCAILTMATGELDMATMQQRDVKHNLEVSPGLLQHGAAHCSMVVS